MNNEKSIAAVLLEIREDLKQFVDTRFQILKTEIREKLARWKRSIPVLAAALVLVATSWMVLTFALVALVHTWLTDSPYSWVWGALIVGGAYLAIGAAAGWLGYKEITSAGFKPERTVTVLKQDRMWIEQERRTA